MSVAGSPRGLPEQVLFGRLSGNSSDGTVESMSISAADGSPIFAENIRVYPLDITVYGGMSGAPVVTNASSVVGVFSGSYSEGRGIGWCIPIGYVTELIGQEPLHRAVSNIGAWPALTLMGPRWISLRRSYDREFSAEHIAELEILEQAKRILKGTWVANASKKKAPYYHSASKCEYTMNEEITLRFTDVDDKSAVLQGTIAWRKHEAVKVAIDTNPYASSPSMQVASCNHFGFDDDDVSSRTTNVFGSIHIGVKSVEDYDNALATYPYITNCQGDGCNADEFGKQDYEDLELISDVKIRIGEYVFTKGAD